MHRRNMTETTGYILSAGKTDYKVVIPCNASKLEKYAAEELTNYFHEATGVCLPIVQDSDMHYSTDSRFISVGSTVPLEKSALLNDFDFKFEGYAIKTHNENIYIYGSNRGTIYGVYDFLGEILELGFYSTVYYAINRAVGSIPLKDFDILETPDFTGRLIGFQRIFKQPETRYKYRIHTDDNQVAGASGHNCLEVIDSQIYCNPEDPENYHPEFYWVSKPCSSDNDSYLIESSVKDFGYQPLQLCYNAHGNAELRRQMIRIATDFFKQKLIDDPNPEHYIITLASQDGYDVCCCPTCQEMALHYNGSNAAAVIKFLNEVYDNLQEWFENEGKPYARQNLSLRFYAYVKLKEPPAIYDSKTDKYSPIDESVVCRKGVTPFVAPIEANHTIPLNDPTSTRNKLHYDNLRGWVACAPAVSLYMYGFMGHSYLAPFNSFKALQANYRLGKEVNASLFYYIGQTTQTGYVTAWEFLKIYLMSNLAWNVNSDVLALTDKFFNKFFCEASDSMREWFEDYLKHAAYIETAFGEQDSFYEMHSDPIQPQYFPKEKLEYWLSCADKALNSIQPIKESNPKLYTEIERNIQGELVSLWYLYLSIYPLSVTTHTRLLPKYNASIEMKKKARTIIEMLGMKWIGAHASENIESLWKIWGIEST